MSGSHAPFRRRAFRVTAVVAVCATLAACSAASSAPGADSPSTTASATASLIADPSSASTPPPTPTATTTTPSAPFVGTMVPLTSLGIHVAGVQDGAWPDKNVPLGSLRLWDAGTNWSQVEAVRGIYNWKALDNALSTAKRNGITDVLLVLGGTPTWNASRVRPGDYPVPGAASPPKSLAAWDAFVGAVVSRYAGRITAYQVWNEASLAMFWNGTPEQLASMTKSAADIIHRRDPKATVVAASTTVRLAGSFNRFFPRYLTALGALGWPVDVIAAHLYPASKGTPEDRAAFVAQVRDALAVAKAPDLPLWDTELNYGLAGPGPLNPLQAIQGTQARDWVVQTSMDSLHLGLARTYWYIWTPKPYPLLGMQLTNDSGAVSGLRIVDQWTVGAVWRGCLDQDVVVACSLARKGIESVIAWASVGSATYSPPPNLTRMCTTDNRCTSVTVPVVLSETPVRFLP